MRRPASITHASAEGGVLGAAVDSVRGVSCSCSALAKETHGQMVSSIARCWTSRAACVLGPSNLQHATHLGWAESTNIWLGSAVLQRMAGFADRLPRGSHSTASVSEEETVERENTDSVHLEYTPT